MPLFKNFFKQLSGDVAGKQGKDLRRGPLQPSSGYHRVPSHGTISASTTSTSLVTDYDHLNQKTFNLEFPVEEEDINSPEEEEDFETTRLHFQQCKQISLDKPKMEMSVRNKDENLRKTIPFVKELSTDSIKVKGEYSINGEGSPYGETTKKINYLRQLCAAIAVSLGSMVVGFTQGYTSPGLASMERDNSTFTITKNQGSWVGGLMPLAALVGGLVGGWLIVRLGRRNTILGISVPFIISWIIIAEARNVTVIYIGRALGGLCVGIGTLSFPVYLGEALQPELRGKFGLLPTAIGNIGILICFIAGKYMDWSPLAYFGAALPIPFMGLMLLIPETAHWYVSRGNHKRARESLQWLRGKEADVDAELSEIVKMKESESNAESSFMDLFKPEYLRPVAISLGMMFFQQLTGINVVIFYTVNIFKAAGSSIDEYLSTIIVGVVNFASVFVATLLIDRLGRKKLMYISGISIVLTLGTLGGFFLVRHLDLKVPNIEWVPLASFVIYVIGFSLGFGPIPWLMMGEILPGRIRGQAASLITAFNWFCTFVLTKCFEDIVKQIGQHGTFWMFGVITVFGLIFTVICVPETQGKSLEEIEKKMCRRR